MYKNIGIKEKINIARNHIYIQQYYRRVNNGNHKEIKVNNVITICTFITSINCIFNFVGVLAYSIIL